MALYAQGGKVKLKNPNITSLLSDVSTGLAGIPVGNYAVYGSAAYASANAPYYAYNPSLTRTIVTSQYQTHLPDKPVGIRDSYGFNLRGAVTTNTSGGYSITNLAEAISPTLTTHALSTAGSAGPAGVCNEFGPKVLIGGGGHTSSSSTIFSYNTSLTRETFANLDDDRMTGATNANFLVAIPYTDDNLNLFNSAGTKTTVNYPGLYFFYGAPVMNWDDYAVFLKDTSSTQGSTLLAIDKSGTINLLDVSASVHLGRYSQLGVLNSKNMGIFSLVAAEGNNTITDSKPRTCVLNNKLTLGDIQSYDFDTAARIIYPTSLISQKTVLGLVEFDSDSSKVAKFTF